MTSTQDFLFELGTEELPPLALKTLSDALLNEVTSMLGEMKLGYESITAFATPRRLALLITNLASAQPDITQTKLGPALAAAFDADGNATKAAEGFARSCGVSVSQLQQIDTDKGVRLGVEATEVGKKFQFWS